MTAHLVVVLDAAVERGRELVREIPYHDDKNTKRHSNTRTRLTTTEHIIFSAETASWRPTPEHELAKQLLRVFK